MAGTGYIPILLQEPDIGEENRDFDANFQRAILLSLLEDHRLTQAQYEACVEKILPKRS